MEKEKTFVQIGSNVGICHDDPLCELILTKGWKGICVEANPKAFELLKENYEGLDLIFENIAISTYDGEISFFIDNYEITKASGHASVKLSHQIGHRHGGKYDIITEIKVPCLTLTSLLEKHNFKNFDFLHIDAEGHDAEIIMCTDFSKFNINSIMFEYAHTDGVHKCGENYKKCIEYLNGFGYILVGRKGLNVILEKR